MSMITEEMQAVLNGDALAHYGMPRRSGRYPYGSGEDPYQHGRDFLGRIEELRKSGFSYTDEQGKTWVGDNAIAKSMGLTTTQFRTELAIATNERRALQVATAKALAKEGKGATEIAKIMGLKNESTARSLLDENSEARMLKAQETADFLKNRMRESAEAGKPMLDVGAGVERELNISREKLNQALYLLEREGYGVYNGGIPQVTNKGQQTNQKVLCPPEIKPKEGAKAPAEIYQFDKIDTVKQYITRDDGKTYEKKFYYPESLDSNRLMIRYKEDGGIDMDGVVQLRRGCKDLSLGESLYSQVRIMVDGSHYIKGMALYGDDKEFPPGVDVIFNTNKTKDKSKMEVLKKIKDDPDNPFGSLIKDADQGGQYWYDPKTGEKVSAKTPGAKLGLVNKRADEGDWDDWSNALPSQFLAKQPYHMIKKQLTLDKNERLSEYEEICSLTNPTVKKHLLGKFADECDAAAVHLKAAALPGQKYHVIIPNNTLKDNEVYAPGYPDGSQLALIRYPHGGTFEIPIVTVNNKNKLGANMIGKQPIDALCVTSKVAERLSGADFDGDTVMAIPTNDPKGKVKIKSTPPLKGLEGFDPKAQYQYDRVEKDEDGVEHLYRNGKEFRKMKNTGTQMGIISNLITDMTLAGAGPDELAAAVRHSMVVIDAEKHGLDYKQSELDNNIAALHKRYQGKTTGGAATILSKAKGQQSVEKTQGTPKINKKGTEDYDPSKPEGALIYKKADDLYYPIRKRDKDTGLMTVRTIDGKKVTYDPKDKAQREMYEPIKRTNAAGEVEYTNAAGTIKYKMGTRMVQSTKMAEAEDAYSLVSPDRNPKEILYADYANDMKSLANQARKEMVYTGKVAYSASAKAAYQPEVKSLQDKLNTALLNAGRERAAQRMANVEVAAKQEANKDMKKGDVKKASQQALSKYRSEMGSVSRRDRSIKITDKEWEAIQAGAISENTLIKILANSDVDSLRERATPRATTTLTPTKINTIKSMSASNYTIDQIAKKLNVSTTIVSKYLKGAS